MKILVQLPIAGERGHWKQLDVEAGEPRINISWDKV